MKKPFRRALFVLFLAVGCYSRSQAASWQTFPVDDSLTFVEAPGPQLRWKSPATGRIDRHTLEATASVRVVLNVQRWIGTPARIFMVMPRQHHSGIAVRWTTTGLLLSGALASGERRLVFEGAIPSLGIEDRLALLITTDARGHGSATRTAFSFEIEVEGK